jgi:hypothetical protein
MKTINVNDKVKYTGVRNNWTFSEDLNENSRGIVINIIRPEEEFHYQVKFENGILASIESNVLEIVI